MIDTLRFFKDNYDPKSYYSKFHRQLAFIIGFIAGIPLTQLLGTTGSVIELFLIGLIIGMPSGTTREKTKVKPKKVKLSKDDEKLITVVVAGSPTIHSPQ